MPANAAKAGKSGETLTRKRKVNAVNNSPCQPLTRETKRSKQCSKATSDMIKSTEKEKIPRRNVVVKDQVSNDRNNNATMVKEFDKKNGKSAKEVKTKLKGRKMMDNIEIQVEGLDQTSDNDNEVHFMPDYEDSFHEEGEID